MLLKRSHINQVTRLWPDEGIVIFTLALVITPSFIGKQCFFALANVHPLASFDEQGPADLFTVLVARPTFAQSDARD
jgi:hypothetical protein